MFAYESQLLIDPTAVWPSATRPARFANCVYDYFNLSVNGSAIHLAHIVHFDPRENRIEREYTATFPLLPIVLLTLNEPFSQSEICDRYILYSFSHPSKMVFFIVIVGSIPPAGVLTFSII